MHVDLEKFTFDCVFPKFKGLSQELLEQYTWNVCTHRNTFSMLNLNKVMDLYVLKSLKSFTSHLQFPLKLIK